MFGHECAGQAVLIFSLRVVDILHSTIRNPYVVRAIEVSYPTCVPGAYIYIYYVPGTLLASQDGLSTNFLPDLAAKVS